MKFVVAPDSFKESLSAKEVCVAMEEGIRTVFPTAEVVHVPMADGGEGTVEAIVDALNGELIERKVQGPLPGQKVKARFGMMVSEKLAVIEMAEASGLELVAKADRNPLITTTYGTGELIKAALDEGAQEIIIGIGGSATNDGGAGMAQALGAKLLKESGEPIEFGGGQLHELHQIDLSDIDARLHDVKIRVASDVNNPLTGDNGAANVFGPQKGADTAMIETLDNNLSHYGQIIKRHSGKEIEHLPGSGAAGGLGAGLIAFTGAKLEEGISIILDIIGLEAEIKDADYVFTGEGGMDFQTKFGKVPQGVARVCRKHNKPLFALAGTLGEDVEVLYEEGITAIFSTLQKPATLEEAIEDGHDNVAKTTENIARILKRVQGE